jgi:CHAD domain-containing protein
MGSIDQSYQLLGARYVRKQLRALDRQIEGARKAEDIECVHQARVASRRLRSAIRMFGDGFPAKKLKKWRKEIRRVTEGLGSARDKDVQVEFVAAFLSGVTEAEKRPGIERLLLRLRQQREALQPNVVKALKRLRDCGVLKDMRATTKAMLSELSARDVTIQSPFVFLRAERLIIRRLEKLLAYQDCLSDPADKQRHHEMRIVTKRLRYTMEICRPVYDGELDEAVTAAKHLQELLGDIHDCDVWIDALPEFMEQERERTLEYCGSAEPLEQLAPGIEHLRRQRQKHRDETFLELGRYWQQLSDRGLWDGLVATILSRVSEPARPAAPEQADVPSEPEPAPADEAPPQPEAPEAPRSAEAPAEVAEEAPPAPAEPAEAPAEGPPASAYEPVLRSEEVAEPAQPDAPVASGRDDEPGPPPQPVP